MVASLRWTLPLPIHVDKRLLDAIDMAGWMESMHQHRHLFRQWVNATLEGRLFIYPRSALPYVLCWAATDDEDDMPVMITGNTLGEAVQWMENYARRGDVRPTS